MPKIKVKKTNKGLKAGGGGGNSTTPTASDNQSAFNGFTPAKKDEDKSDQDASPAPRSQVSIKRKALIKRSSDNKNNAGSPQQTASNKIKELREKTI